MPQLPIFLNLDGQPVILLGEGDSADAKRRLIERGGGVCVDEDNREARLAFIAIEDDTEAHSAAARLKARGLLVNVVDRPALCDFTTPAIVDRSPLLLAIGTGGASAGLAKAVRQRLEQQLPKELGTLANALFANKAKLKERFPDGADRRRAIDAAFDEGGLLDPMMPHTQDDVERWLTQAQAPDSNRLQDIALTSNDPDDLTLRQARLLGQADTIYYSADVAEAVLNRARADAVRIAGNAPDTLPAGLSLSLHLQKQGGA